MIYNYASIHPHFTVSSPMDKPCFEQCNAKINDEFNIVFFAHLPVFVHELKVLQYIKRNYTKSVFSRPD